MSTITDISDPTSLLTYTEFAVDVLTTFDQDNINGESEGAPAIICRVCRATINIEIRMTQHVVKCQHCNEATPIRSPPPGKKFVRCACNCLLICKASSDCIACPRPNCNRVITMRARAALLRCQEQYKSTIGQLQQRIVQLENELATSQELIDRISEENERYRSQAVLQQIASKLEDSERKAQGSEDKYLKMKEAYEKLQDKHIETAKKLQLSQLELDESRKSLAQFLASQQSNINSDELETLVEKEMKMMDDAIRLAAAKMEEILQKNREESSGVRLEVNEKILDACTALMRAIMELIRNAKELQREIVDKGRGSAEVKEFYKRHHQWSEGLLSSAKAVGLGANVLVDTADRTVSGQGKYEELMVASQEIAASVARLVVASRVKADPSSTQLSALSGSSKNVTSAAAAVVGNVKSARETLNENGTVDLSHLSLHQAKRLEMDSQVRVLELEYEVEKQRVRLGTLRKRCFQLAGLDEGVCDERPIKKIRRQSCHS